ncbi:hypothetical protein U8P76_29465 (plasmid) [Rhizobium johnstonii]|nr:hypothetical protein U8P76_29465 [Rhizobium johnstonii]
MGSKTAGVGRVVTVLVHTVTRGTDVEIPEVPVRPATTGAKSFSKLSIKFVDALIFNWMIHLAGLGKPLVRS